MASNRKVASTKTVSFKGHSETQAEFYSSLGMQDAGGILIYFFAVCPLQLLCIDDDEKKEYQAKLFQY